MILRDWWEFCANSLKFWNFKLVLVYLRKCLFRYLIQIFGKSYEKICNSVANSGNLYFYIL